MDNNNHISGIKLIILHVLPGIILALIFIPIALLARHYNLPPLLSIYISIPIGGIPVLLGYLLFIGEKYNKSFSLKKIIKYRQRIYAWQYFLFVPVSILIAIGIFYLFQSIDNLILEDIFSLECKSLVDGRL